MKKVEMLSLATPSDLGATNCRSIAHAVNPLIANVFALYVKTKNFHWHMSGSHYRDYHLLLDEQSDQLLAMVDVLAERVRKLGEKTIQSISQIHELQDIKDEHGMLPAEEMIQILMQDNKTLLSQMRSVHKVCSEAQDVATTSILENYIDETEKRIWFLFETLGG